MSKAKKQLKSALENILKRPMREDADNALQRFADGGTSEPDETQKILEEAQPEQVRSEMTPDTSTTDQMVAQAQPEQMMTPMDQQQPASEEENKSSIYDEQPEPTEEQKAAPSEEEEPSEEEKPSELNDQEKQQANSTVNQVLNFGTPQQNQSQLDSLLKHQRLNVGLNQLSAALNTVSAGIAGVAPNPQLFEQQIQQSGLPIQQYMLKQQQEVNDPSSGISSGMRDMMKRLGYPVSEGATASQIGQVLPGIQRAIASQQAIQARHEDLQARLESARMMKEASLANAKAIRDSNREYQNAKQQDNNNFKLSGQVNQFRSQPGLQNDLRAIQAADQALQTLDNPRWKGNLNNIPVPIANALTTDLATIYSRGVASDNVIKELNNPTFMANYEQFISKVGNKPTPGQLGAFLKQNQDLFKDLRDGSQKRIDKHYRDILNTAGKSVSPETLENYRIQLLPNDSYDPKTNNLIPTQATTSNVPPGTFDINLPPDARQNAVDELKRRGILK